MVDRGSTFTLTLRLERVAQASLAGGEPRAITESAAGRPAVEDTAGRTAPVRPPATMRRLLVLDRGGLALHAIRGLVGRDHAVELTSTADPQDALSLLAMGAPDCLIIGSRLSKTAVFTLLDQLHRRGDVRRLPVILRLDRRVTERDRARLNRYEPMLLPRVVESDEALAAEAALVLHPAGGPAVAGPDRGEIQVSKDPTPSLRGRILLVDDDVRNLFALASLLEDRGLEVVFSETGHEALEILGADQQIDLVLMDIMMPQMDGYETIRAVREMPALRSLPIIAVTAKAMQGDREKSLAAGATDYITKPVDPDKLMALISGCLVPDRV
jgi:CheY-like chemotaxis protein